MFADIHAHLLDSAFDETREIIIRDLSSKGVSFIVENSTCPDDMIRASKLAEKNSNIYAAVGIYPDFSFMYNRDVESVIKELVKKNKRTLVIGEIGLDYHYDDSPDRKIQIDCFEKQLALAEELGVPVEIHSRDASEDTLDIIKSSKVKGLMHCFSGSVETALNYIDLGFYISFGGVLTFKKTKKQIEVLKSIPKNRILTETDCPYMAPEPKRGSVNEPAFIRYVIEKMSDILGMEYDDIESQTLKNAIEFLGI